MARRAEAIPRRSLFDSLTDHSDQNLYCRRDSLTNEASVETFFVNRLLADLGYKDHQIQTKKSITELTVSLGGSRFVRYKPDYAITLRKKPKWILDAKGTGEKIEDWIPQCSGYCLGVNQTYKDDNPVQYFVLTNGLRTNVYRWDHNEPLLAMSFSDFDIGNPKYEQLKSILASAKLSAPRKKRCQEPFLRRKVKEKVKKRCHLR